MTEMAVAPPEAPPPATAPPAPLISLFGDTPTKAYEKMQEIVGIIKVAIPENGMLDVLKFNQQGGGKRDQQHVSVEGWVFVGGLVGVTTRTRWTRQWRGEIDIIEWQGPKGSRKKVPRRVTTEGWESYEEVVTLQGVVIGGHEGMCLKVETRWDNADEYAIRSMAQTRARSQALAGVLRHLVEMAGFKGTPAEEMTGVVDRQDMGDDPDETRREAQRVYPDSWGGMLKAIDGVVNDERNLARDWFGMAASATCKVAIEKPADIPEEHKVPLFQGLKAVYDGLLDLKPGDLGLTPEQVVKVWRDAFPVLTGGGVAEKTEAEPAPAAEPAPESAAPAEEPKAEEQAPAETTEEGTSE